MLDAFMNDDVLRTIYLLLHHSTLKKSHLTAPKKPNKDLLLFGKPWYVLTYKDSHHIFLMTQCVHTN